MDQLRCPFCHNDEPRVASNQSAFAIPDRRPVSPGHCLVISNSHVPTIFDLAPEEYAACFALLRKLRDLLAEERNAESFNVVVNCGAEANQTVRHAHIHLVPRYPNVPLPSAVDAWSGVR